MIEGVYYKEGRKMKVLFKTCASTYCMSVKSIYCATVSGVEGLVIEPVDGGDWFTIMPLDEADTMVRTLFKLGMIDVTDFETKILGDDEPYKMFDDHLELNWEE